MERTLLFRFQLSIYWYVQSRFHYAELLCRISIGETFESRNDIKWCKNPFVKIHILVGMVVVEKRSLYYPISCQTFVPIFEKSFDLQEMYHQSIFFAQNQNRCLYKNMVHPISFLNILLYTTNDKSLSVNPGNNQNAGPSPSVFSEKKPSAALPYL